MPDKPARTILFHLKEREFEEKITKHRELTRKVNYMIEGCFESMVSREGQRGLGKYGDSSKAYIEALRPALREKVDGLVFNGRKLHVNPGRIYRVEVSPKSTELFVNNCENFKLNPISKDQLFGYQKPIHRGHNVDYKVVYK